MSQVRHRPIKRLLIANRGEIATRIVSTARELGLETFTLYTTNDASHTHGSTCSIELKSPGSYLDISELISIIRSHKIDAVHPGYGFLSESPEFASRVSSETEAFVIGPGAEILKRTGDKLKARLLAEDCSVPMLRALKLPTRDISVLSSFGNEVGYPIIIKAVDGGGGRGIRIVRSDKELPGLAKRALQESPSGLAFAEKAAIEGYRHVEVQIVGDGKGEVRHLWERECSVQRRFQKVIEMAPSSVLDRSLVAEVISAALRMAKNINYSSLGTFEFLVQPETKEFYFLEINPRIQVEHTITESVAMGVDLVNIQLLLAQGHSISSLPLPVSLPADPAERPPPIHSLQLRVCAEDPGHDFSLSVGKISSFHFPSGNGIRVDTHLHSSYPMVVGTDFDSLLAKIIITGLSWEDVVRRAKRVLEDTFIEGITTNLVILRGIVSSAAFRDQKCDTQWLEANLPSILSSGKDISEKSLRLSSKTAASHDKALLHQVSTNSNTLFRKGDAWAISLTPDQGGAEHKSHIQLLRVNRNEFPSSLSASIMHSTPSSSTPYTLTLKSTTESSASLANAAAHRRGDANDPSHVIFPFPGKLVEFCLEAGDQVRKGDTIAVVRQMKMELEVRAGRSGRVTWVYDGEEGDEVAEGVLVAVIEGEKDGGSKL